MVNTKKNLRMSKNNRKSKKRAGSSSSSAKRSSSSSAKRSSRTPRSRRSKPSRRSTRSLLTNVMTAALLAGNQSVQGVNHQSFKGYGTPEHMKIIANAVAEGEHLQNERYFDKFPPPTPAPPTSRDNEKFKADLLAEISELENTMIELNRKQKKLNNEKRDNRVKIARSAIGSRRPRSPSLDWVKNKVLKNRNVEINRILSGIQEQIETTKADIVNKNSQLNQLGY